MKRTKSNKRHAVNLIAILALLFLTQNIALSQVVSRVLGADEKIEKYIPWYFLEKPEATDMPVVDVQQVLLLDSINGRVLPRFGVEKEMNLNTSDGTLYKFGNYRIWKLVVHSSGAKTISFRLRNTFLPDGSQMFIYNPETKFVAGPILQKNFHNGVFNSDFIAGDYAIIEVFLPGRTNEGFSIDVKDAVHGIVGYKFDADYNTSEPCNVNTTCPAGIGWENEIDAVCKIFVGNGGTCTGTLINNECSDLTPYILTANHCIVGNPAGYVFRFNYESLDCAGIEPAPYLWTTFSGAILRASSATSDFALLELNDPITGLNSPYEGTDISFAGWNRNTAPPDQYCDRHTPSERRCKKNIVQH